MAQFLICSVCNETNRATARFCNQCGEPLAPPGERPCPRCGEPNPPASRFCSICGTRFGARTTVGEPLPRLAAPASPLPPARRLLWWYIPADSLLHAPSFRAMITMRVATESAINALSYGMLIQIVKTTEDARLIGILSALVTISTVAPAALFGPLGGVVVDRMPKRFMLIVTNVARALLCFGFLFLGTGLATVYALLVAITVVTQFATPAESAIVPRVVTPDRLAAANSFSNLAESAGALLGTAILAPVMVRLFRTPEPLIIASGLLLTYAAVRAVAIHLLTPEERTPRPQRDDDTARRPWMAGTRESLLEAWQWLAGDRAAFISMLLLVLASTANLVIVTLFPKFAQEVLGVPPELAVYVFFPAVAGVLLGLALTPKLAEHVQKRLLVTIGFLLMVVVLLLFGGVNQLAVLLRGFGPIGTLFERGPLAYRDGRLGAALLLALPLGFGLSMVQVAAQTLLHERVPLAMQGRVFALQGAVKNAVATLPLLVLGGLASLLGDTRPVLVIASVSILALALYGAARSASWTAPRVPHPEPLSGTPE